MRFFFWTVYITRTLSKYYELCVLIRSYLTINKVNNKKYHTVGTVPKSYRETKNITLSEQFQNTTLSEQFQNTKLSEQFQNPIEKQKIPHCRNSFKIL
jgi:hypothetical protein